jgi:hypothetical protein
MISSDIGKIVLMTDHSKPLLQLKFGSMPDSPKKPYHPWKRLEPKKSMIAGNS